MYEAGGGESWLALSRRPSDEGGHHIGSVAVQRDPGPVAAHSGAGVACEAASWTSRKGTPASNGGNESLAQGMRAGAAWLCRPVGPPAVRCGRHRGRPGASPSGPRNSGPSLFSPIARSMARAVRGANGTVTTLPPLRKMVRVRWPRCKPSASILAPVASEAAARSGPARTGGRARGLARGRQRRAGHPPRCGQGRWHGTRSRCGVSARAQPVNGRSSSSSTA